jgi:glycolate oxidase iron-sulfur subunit
MACVTACPSGVQYDRLIEDTRAQVERRHPAPAGPAAAAAIFALFPYPRRLRLLRGPLRATSSGSAAWSAAAAAARWRPRWPRWSRWRRRLRSVPRPPRRVPARGTAPAVVGMLTGCVQRAFFPEVNAATVRVLAPRAATW